MCCVVSYGTVQALSDGREGLDTSNSGGLAGLYYQCDPKSEWTQAKMAAPTPIYYTGEGSR